MTTSTPSILPKKSTSALAYYLVYFFLVSMPAIVCLAFLLQVTPTFKEIFKDFKIAMPAYTECMLALADLVGSGGWIIILLTVLLVPILPSRWTARNSSRQMRFNQLFLAFNLIFLLSVISASLAVIAIYLPLIKLVQSVSGHDAGSE